MDAKKKRCIVFGIMLAIGLLVFGIRYFILFRENPIAIEHETEITSDVLQETDEQVEASLLIDKLPDDSSVTSEYSISFSVYICGAVIKPGIYVVESETYLYEVIDMAGGLTDEAADEWIDFVYVLDKAQSIYIPERADVNESVNREYDDFYEIEISPWCDNHDDSDVLDKVNINTADLSMLCTIPGIGEVMAQSIIDYRENNGEYTCIEDIMNVSGIKNGKFNQIKEYITV